MTVPANLFVEAPEVEDRALISLGNDVNAWPEEIIQKLKERVPQAQSMATMVKFMKKEEESGAATGSIIITAPETTVVVPIIIKDFKMCPLDVMIAKGKILPLTQDYFNEATSKNQVFDRIEEYPSYSGLGRFEEANLWNAMYPPSLGRYAYASAGYPLLDSLSDNISGNELKEWIKNNPEYLAGFHKHGHMELIKKVANLQPVNMNEFSQGAHNLVPQSIRVLRHDGPNKYTLLSSSDKVFSPALDGMCRSAAVDFCSKISADADDDVNDVDMNGEKILSLPEPEDKVFLARTDKEVPERATEYDSYVVAKKNGVFVEGVVIPKVIGFNQKPTNLKIFIGKTMSSVQPEIWGKRLKNSRFNPECTAPAVGQTGTFLYQPDKSHALATIPVTIKSITNDMGALKIQAMGLMGAPYKLKINPTMGLKRIALLEGEYLLPKEMKWVVMEGFGEISNSAESYAIKTAAQKLTDRPVKIGYNGYERFSMRGVDKYASVAGFDKTDMGSAEVKFLLACLGAGMDKIGSALKLAKMRGIAEVHGLRFIPTKGEKIASYRPRALSLVKSAAAIKRNLFKEASYVDNAQTVDALLSLNFVSPDNISKFIGKIPHFKATISNLAGALLGSRLGIKEIPEEACSVAMARLVEVVDGLERLRSSQEVQGQNA